MSTFGKRNKVGLAPSGRNDRHGPAHSGLTPERNARRFFFHDKKVMFWGVLIGLLSFPFAFYLWTGKLLFGSMIGSGLFMVFGIMMTLLLSRTGQLDDKPENDIRGFFLGGPWFLFGASLGAGYVFWNDGFEWLWSYDLTKVDFAFGFHPIGGESNAVGLVGFLEKFTKLLTVALGGGAILKQLAVKIGLDKTFSDNASERD